MCLVISGVFAYVSYMFYTQADTLNMLINGSISLFFIGLMIRNFIKTKKEKAQNQKK